MSRVERINLLARSAPRALCDVLGVDRRACEDHLNDTRARVGISHFRIERALADEQALQTALATAIPVPRGWRWLGWLGDARGAGVAHAFHAACVAFQRDPRFFDRPTWPTDLIRIMSPLPEGALLASLAVWLGAVGGVASARARVRRASHRSAWGWPGAVVWGGAAVGWGRVEAGLRARCIARGVEAYLRRIDVARADSAHSKPWNDEGRAVDARP